MTKVLRRSVIIMLTFIMTLLMSGGVLTRWEYEELGQYQFAAKITDENGAAVTGVTVKAYEAGTTTLAKANKAQYAWQTEDWQDVVLVSNTDGEIVQNVQKLNVSSVDFKVEDEKYESETTYTVEIESGKIVKVNGEAVAFDSNGFAPAKVFAVTEKSQGPAPDPNAPWGETDFTVNETGETVTGLTTAGKEKLKVQPDMVIPDKINGVEITAIGDGVAGTSGKDQIGTFGFKEGENYFIPKSLKLPSGLKTIGSNSFCGVALSGGELNGVKYGVEAVEFPEGLEKIGMAAFQNSLLTSVILPDSVTELGVGAFTGAHLVDTIKLSSGLEIIPQNAFTHTAATGVEIKAVKKVEIPNGVKTIGRGAFNGCLVEELTLPDSLELIDQQAFYNHSLKELNIPKSVKTIGKSAFKIDTNESRPASLKTLNIPEDSVLTSIGKEAFDSALLKEVDIPKSVTTLNADAFKNNVSGIDDNKVLLKVTSEEQFTGSKTFVAEGSGHKVSVEVTFDANGGNAIDPATVKTAMGFKVENLPEPTHEDPMASFDGWFTEKEGGEKVKADTQYLKNTTVYAHWINVKEEAQNAVKAADDAAKAADQAKKDADAAKKTADADKAAADEAAKTPGPAAVAAAEKAVQSAKTAAAAAAKAKEAADAAKTAADDAVAKADAYAAKATTDADKAAAAALKETAAGQAKEAEKAAAAAATAKENADKAATAAATAKKSAESAAASAAAADAKVKSVTTVTVNVATVDKKAINKAINNAGGSSQYVTKVVLGKKVKKIKKNTFKTFKNVKTIEVKSKKLKKSSVKKSLAGSKVKTVKIKVGKKSANKKYVKKYKKIFTKKNAGKKVAVK